MQTYTYHNEQGANKNRNYSDYDAVKVIADVVERAQANADQNRQLNESSLKKCAHAKKINKKCLITAQIIEL